MNNIAAVLMLSIFIVACNDRRQEPESVGDLTRYSVSELLFFLDNKKITSVEIVGQLFDKADERKSLNAYIYADRERALALAATADAARVSGSKGQPLLGIPIVVKDNIHVAGMPNTAGSPALKGFIPDSSNSVVESLRVAGAIVIAKTNMHELAFGITSNNYEFGAVGNPYDETKFAGGSSGGTATAVSAGLAPAGLGTDTGGSVRIPAALTGVVGFRPSSGRYISTAVTPISATRDTVGLIATNVADIILLDGIVTGRKSSLDKVDVRDLRLGVPRAFLYDNVDVMALVIIEDTLQKLRAAGVTLVEADVEDIEALVAQTAFPIALYEVVRQLPVYLEEFHTGVSYDQLVAGVASPDVQGVFGMLAGGGPIDDADYAAAMAARQSMKESFRKYFAENNIDAIVFPTTLLPARSITGSDETVILNGAQVPTFPTYIHNTDHASIAGLPSISIPAGLTQSGLPIGVALEGPEGSDGRLLAIALAIEQELAMDAP